jgi:transcription elongation factor GreA
MPDPIVMTPEGLAALEAELRQLETEGRREIAERIRVAREWGDLKENSEYHDAKNSQAHLETKIKRLREQLLAAEVRDAPAPTDVVGFGSRVEVEDDAGRRRSYTLVSETEAEPAAGRVSIASPVGQALEGAKPGDTVTVPTPRGDRALKVVSIGA